MIKKLHNFYERPFLQKFLRKIVSIGLNTRDMKKKILKFEKKFFKISFSHKTTNDRFSGSIQERY